MVITINNKDYLCLNFECINTEGVEHLNISIEGELKDTKNRLHIDYNNKSYFGCKLLPSYNRGKTNFLVYIYQKGDSEL